MASVIERLREIQSRAWGPFITHSDVNLIDDALPTLLALAEVAQRIDSDMQENKDNTVCDTDKADLRSALAELEKEAG